MRFRSLFLVIVIVVSAALFVGCSDKDTATTTRVADSGQASAQPTNQITIPEDTQLKEESDKELCFLSPCDCNCYVVGHVPASASKPTCGLDCEADYGYVGCEYAVSNQRCNPIKK